MPMYLYLCLLMCSCTTIFATMSPRLSTLSDQFTLSRHWTEKQNQEPAQAAYSVQLHEDQGRREISEDVASEQLSAIEQYEAAHACLKTDPKRAAELFQLAANRGNIDAQHDLAVCYLKGVGVKKNFQKVEYWFEMAANGGDIQARIDLGSCYFEKKQYAKAFENFSLAASLNNASAQCFVGVCYEKGYGINKSDKMAVKYYKLAAKQNYAEAQYRLGLHYLSGEGLDDIDEDRAIIWLQQAAEKGHEKAKSALLPLNLRLVLAQEAKEAELIVNAKENSEMREKSFPKQISAAKTTVITQRGTGEKRSIFAPVPKPILRKE